jgi:hypothetical protein
VTWGVKIIIAVLMVMAVFVAPVGLVWGWVRWVRSPKMKTAASAFSLIGFAFASCSALLAIGTAVYVQRIGGFGFYDPVHLRLVRWGSLLSVIGFVVALCGVSRRNTLRWHSVAATLGTFAYWILVAESE